MLHERLDQLRTKLHPVIWNGGGDNDAIESIAASRSTQPNVHTAPKVDANVRGRVTELTTSPSALCTRQAQFRDDNSSSNNKLLTTLLTTRASQSIFAGDAGGHGTSSAS